MFERKGVIEFDGEKLSEEEVMDVALEAGAEDIVNEDGVITVTTAPNDFTSVMEALEKKQKPEDDKKKKDDEEDPWKPLSAEVAMVPLSYTDVDMDTAAKVQKLLDKLEEDDDVQNVWSTVNYPDGFEG